MADDQFKLHNYQDDLNSHDYYIDRITAEQTDDLSQTTGAPDAEIAKELKRDQTAEREQGSPGEEDNLADRDPTIRAQQRRDDRNLDA